jgi:hypothetical protein
MKKKSPAVFYIPMASALAAYVASLFLLSAVARNATAAISFEDVSQSSGVNLTFPTAASAWGDFNGDGWPDLWVSNHDMKEPSLYLNLKDGAFMEAAKGILIGNPRADFHGAAWADFDNDADQDLIVLTGGGAGRGRCPNFLFVNQDGKLQDKAQQLGLDYPLGRGRTPLWFDADRDGKLDLLVMNRFRAENKAPSAIFLQTVSGFSTSNDKFGFNPLGSRTRFEMMGDLLSNAVHFRFRKGAGEITPAEAFAQLADLSGDGAVDLVAYVAPMRVYEISKNPYDEITNDIGFKTIHSVQDAAIEDFNGDGQMEIFLARASQRSDISRISSSKVVGIVKQASSTDHKGVRFQCKGEVTFNIHVPWADPSDPGKPPLVIPGKLDPVPADGRSLTLSFDDPALQQIVTLPDDSVSIEYDPKSGEWKVLTSYWAISFIAASDKPIEKIEAIGFNPSKGDLPDVLLVKGPNGFEPFSDSGFSARSTASFSVAAGDFDNDMDIDLYLVCTGPAHNMANILYANDSAGHFTEISNAGGAQGSDEGRGNQVSVCDYDRDGFLDLFVTNGAGAPPFSEGPHQLFHNNGNTHHWLEIDLQGSTSNRDGIGAVVELEAGGVKSLRVQDGGMHSFSQDCQQIHFGLGKNTKADKLTIHWPSGIIQEIKDIAANQILKIVESDAVR